jgi:hypothetical protein
MRNIQRVRTDIAGVSELETLEHATLPVGAPDRSQRGFPANPVEEPDDALAP